MDLNDFVRGMLLVPLFDYFRNCRSSFASRMCR